MTQKTLAVWIPAVFLLSFGVPAGGQGNRKTIQVSGRPITAMRQIADGTKSVDWSEKLNLIAFERMGPRRYFEVYTMRPDGSGERCLTGGGNAPRKHNGSPSWHPSGEYIVFGGEKPETPNRLDRWAIPGTGLNCDLWVMTADGKRYWRLTNLPMGTGRNIPGLIHPQFSRNGQKVFWAERTGGGGGWGQWVLRVADFVATPEPHLGPIKTLDPGSRRNAAGVGGEGRRRGSTGAARFYESHDFSPDGTKILFCGNLLPGQQQHGMDIYELTLASGVVQRLTDTFDDWDEHAHFSPDGRKIIWMSSTGSDIRWGDTRAGAWQQYVKTDLWMMNADGSGKVRLTYFNDPGSPEYFGKRCIVSDNAWSPDGQQIVVTVAYEAPPRLNSKCFVLDVK